MIDAWRQQLDFLTDTYLRWKVEGPPSMDLDTVSAEFWSAEAHPITYMPRSNMLNPSLSVLTITLTNVPTARSLQKFYHFPDSITVNQTLVRNGYIGATPERPSIAFSITLFEIFRQIHRVCPHLSIYGITKVLSHIHGVRLCVLNLAFF